MKKEGFTLIELLAVVAIIAILIVLVVPAIINVYNSFQKKAFITEAKSVYRATLNKINSDNLKNETIEEYNSVDKKVAINSKKINYLINISNNKNINSFCVSNGKYKLIIDNGEIISIDELEEDDYLSMRTDDELSCVSSLVADINLVALYVDTDGDGSYSDETNEGKVDSLSPSEHYVLDLVNSNCTSGTLNSWNDSTRSINISGISQRTECNLYFKTGGELKTLPSASLLGKYVTYIGDNGCLNCAGYGYTSSVINGATILNKLSTSTDLNSWRIAYLDANNIYIISTNPVFPTYLDSGTWFQSLNNEAVKYCNPDYVEGGACQTTYNAAGANHNTWAIADADFQQMTLQNIGVLKTLDSCYNQATAACGYNNDLIQKPSYWFATKMNNGSIYLPYYNSSSIVANIIGNTNYTMGLRPIIKLKSGITYSGGTGTSTNPYILTP